MTHDHRRRSFVSSYYSTENFSTYLDNKVLFQQKRKLKIEHDNNARGIEFTKTHWSLVASLEAHRDGRCMSFSSRRPSFYVDTQ